MRPRNVKSLTFIICCFSLLHLQYLFYNQPLLNSDYVNYLDLIFINLYRYESAEVALNCGMMLRECLRHEPLARMVLFSEDFFCFFRYVELSTFDIASDAFASFKV